MAGISSISIRVEMLRFTKYFPKITIKVTLWEDVFKPLDIQVYK